MSVALPHSTVWFAVALKVPDGAHCGIVFESKSGGTKYLHFAWRGDLRCNSVVPNYEQKLKLIHSDLTELNKQTLALISEDIYSHNSATEIPYSFNALGVEFDAVTNEFRAAGIGTGLSCATFIVAVMQRAGFRLVDILTWRSDAEDFRVRDKVLSNLRGELGPDHPHVVAMAAEEKLYRIRPADVAGANQQPYKLWPVNFDTARDEGICLLQEMNPSSTERFTL